jgi:exopolysaccharide biosynthesis polyprenyl glycosylphosphotransferase
LFVAEVRPITDANDARAALRQAFAFQAQAETLSHEAANKRFLDLFVSALLIVTLSPVLLLIAVAILLDSKGPVFFRQSRTGLAGQTFRIFKFRSMHVMEDGALVRQCQKNDARVTRVGRFLRSSSLDELPQLFNVLLGDMSLVGPRPHAVSHDEFYGARIATYLLRQSVKPGITGWAQINGLRGETQTVAQMADRVNFDIWYARHASVALDIKILLKTPLAVLRGEGAH